MAPLQNVEFENSVKTRFSSLRLNTMHRTRYNLVHMSVTSAVTRHIQFALIAEGDRLRSPKYCIQNLVKFAVFSLHRSTWLTHHRIDCHMPKFSLIHEWVENGSQVFQSMRSTLKLLTWCTRLGEIGFEKHTILIIPSPAHPEQLLVLSLKLLSPVISLPSYALSICSGSLNASNTSSFHLPTKFSQLPNLHIFITSSPFNILAVLALHPSLLLLGHLHRPL